MSVEFQPAVMSEHIRIDTLIARNGLQPTQEWARQTAALYRQSISDPLHFASQPDWKPQFERIIRVLEHLAETGQRPQEATS
jgi:hypothetical protein